jgi:hypothetical protein
MALFRKNGRQNRHQVCKSATVAQSLVMQGIAWCERAENRLKNVDGLGKFWSG